jgi:predicted nuclease with TOPRIM domain
LTTLQQELDAEKANHGETTGKLSSKDQEYSKLQEELDARGVESEGHKTRISELETVSHVHPHLTRST